MIALDTNALVRLLTEDDPEQAETVQETVLSAEKSRVKILILSEVLLETVWVLESVYGCTREKVAMYMEHILALDSFFFSDYSIIQKAVEQYKLRGDFGDLIIVGQARNHNAERLISFDKKLQKRFPDYVVETLDDDSMKKI